MDENQQLEEVLLARLDGCQAGDEAAILLDDVLMARHDHFQLEGIRQLDLSGNGDATYHEISEACENASGKQTMSKYTNKTPDAYLVENGKLYIVDFKVAGDIRKRAAETIRKYEDAYKELAAEHGLQLVVVIIGMQPYTMRQVITVHDGRFQEVRLDDDMIGAIGVYTRVGDEIKRRWAQDDAFKAKMAKEEDVLKTEAWFSDDVDEVLDVLFEDETFKMFIESLGDDAGAFIDVLGTDMVEEGQEKLEKLRGKFGAASEMAINNILKSVGQAKRKKAQSTPSKDQIDAGMAKMKERLEGMNEMSESLNDAKPSCHVIIGDAPFKARTEAEGLDTNTKALVGFLDEMDGIEGNTTWSSIAKYLAECCDVRAGIDKYMEAKDVWKGETSDHSRKEEKKERVVVECGIALVEGVSKFRFKKDSRRDTLIAKCKAGKGYKTFKNRTANDIGLSEDGNFKVEKKKCLNGFSRSLEADCYLEGVLAAAKLSKPAKCPMVMKDCFDHEKIEKAAQNKNFDKILNSKAMADCVNVSQLAKGMMVASTNVRKNNMMVIHSADQSTLCFVLHSPDLQQANGDILYMTISKHQTVPYHTGAEAERIPLKNGQYMVISRPMRIAKPRLKVLLESPSKYMTMAYDLSLGYTDMDEIVFGEIVMMAYYASMNITKSLVSVVEPARYILANTMADKSDVNGFLSDKWDPCPKTFFSVFCMQKIIAAMYRLNLDVKKVMFDSAKFDVSENLQNKATRSMNFKSIWFSAQIKDFSQWLKEMLIFYYASPKGLHDPVHNLRQLCNVPTEFEDDWDKQTAHEKDLRSAWDNTGMISVEVNVLVHSIADYMLRTRDFEPRVRKIISESAGFEKPITTIKTMTSPKSCVERIEKQEKLNKAEEKMKEKGKRTKLDVMEQCQDYVPVRTTKVFDKCYQMCKKEDGVITKDVIADSIMNHEEFLCTMFEKGQRTAHDREIYEMEMEGKFGLYYIEQVSKQSCRMDPTEMISVPGEHKIIEMKKIRSKAMRRAVDAVKHGRHAKIIQINADQSKWSARDLTMKYLWMFAMMPQLRVVEKAMACLFLCKYMRKKLVIPDRVLAGLLDMKVKSITSRLYDMTIGASRNYIPVRQNWLQGNMNYTSSLMHSITMDRYAHVLKQWARSKGCEIYVDPLVHSDDNCTTIVVISEKEVDNEWDHWVVDIMDKVQGCFGVILNAKKSYTSAYMMEFISSYIVNGECVPISCRQTLPVSGDTAFSSPQEDLSARISAVQSAVAMSTEPSMCHVLIGCANFSTYHVYNMCSGQENDPLRCTAWTDRRKMPIQAGGYLDAPLEMIGLLGTAAHDISLITQAVKEIKMKDVMLGRLEIADVEFTDAEVMKLETNLKKSMKFLSKMQDVETTLDSPEGYIINADERKSVLIKPGRFITQKLMEKLEVYQDYKTEEDANKSADTIGYVAQRPYILVTKPKTKEDYMNALRFRMQSRQFREAISVQSSTQLMVDRVLNSRKKTVRGTFLQDFNQVFKAEKEESEDLAGRITIKEALVKIDEYATADPTAADMMNAVRNEILTDVRATSMANLSLMFTDVGYVVKPALQPIKMPSPPGVANFINTPAVVTKEALFPGSVERDGDKVTMETLLPAEVLKLNEYLISVGLDDYINRKAEENDGTIDKQKEYISAVCTVMNIGYRVVGGIHQAKRIYYSTSRSPSYHSLVMEMAGAMKEDGKLIITRTIGKTANMDEAGKLQTMIREKMETKLVRTFLSLVMGVEKIVAKEMRKEALRALVKDLKYEGKPLVEHLIEKQKMLRHVAPKPMMSLGLLSFEDFIEVSSKSAEISVIWRSAQKDRRAFIGNFSVTYYSSGVMLTIEGGTEGVTMYKVSVTKEVSVNPDAERKMRFKLLERAADDFQNQALFDRGSRHHRAPSDGLIMKKKMYGKKRYVFLHVRKGRELGPGTVFLARFKEGRIETVDQDLEKLYEGNMLNEDLRVIYLKDGAMQRAKMAHPSHLTMLQPTGSEGIWKLNRMITSGKMQEFLIGNTLSINLYDIADWVESEMPDESYFDFDISEEATEEDVLLDIGYVVYGGGIGRRSMKEKLDGEINRLTDKMRSFLSCMIEGEPIYEMSAGMTDDEVTAAGMITAGMDAMVAAMPSCIEAAICGKMVRSWCQLMGRLGDVIKEADEYAFDKMGDLMEPEMMELLQGMIRCARNSEMFEIERVTTGVLGCFERYQRMMEQRRAERGGALKRLKSRVKKE
ncbi:RNA-dependent RNA polymerase [Largemouth bass bunyavirus]|uniref:RNA-directed RNA polymerase L n=1 Tax=Largemouth bass bunyavirus TaxID=2594110 RepID=A0A514TTR6_9VIRU|nr:RNA-dependent RNA polymerase [Largemouth bass bunyavirus]QDJ95875.1 RNA-dependent RNA polymerase [Largemouth bass bunyavirus]